MWLSNTITFSLFSVLSLFFLLAEFDIVDHFLPRKFCLDFWDTVILNSSPMSPTTLYFLPGSISSAGVSKGSYSSHLTWPCWMISCNLKVPTITYVSLKYWFLNSSLGFPSVIGLNANLQAQYCLLKPVLWLFPCLPCLSYLQFYLPYGPGSWIICFPSPFLTVYI